MADSGPVLLMQRRVQRATRNKPLPQLGDGAGLRRHTRDIVSAPAVAELV